MNNKLQYTVIKVFTVVALVLFVQLSGCSSNNVEPEVWSVTQSHNFGRMPRWNPDGTKIAFGDDRPGQAGIWIWNSDQVSPSPVVTLLSRLIPHNWDYCWSPDGGKIAFSSPAAPEDSLGGVWVADLATNETIRIWDRGRDVSWGDSGNALYFQIENPVGGVPGIYAITLPQAEDTLSQYPRFIAAQGFKPQGRPLSNQVAYGDGLIDGRVWVGGEGVNPVVVSGYGALQWDWSSDGRFLFVIVNRYVTGTIKGVLWRIDGRADLNPPFMADSLTSWTSNLSVNRSGSTIAFARSSGSTWLGIWIHRDGEDVQIITYGENPDIHPIEEKVAMNANGGGIRIVTRQQ